jgi:Flp pilus assembly protein TadG
MKTRNRSTGQLVIELASTCVFLLIFVLVSVDIGLLLYGAHINDKACRDACRAAAQTNNATDARRVAEAVLSGQRLAGDTVGKGIVTRPTIPAGAAGLTYVDYNGTPAPDESPYVTVVTECNSTLPFAPPELLGHSMNQSFTFRQSYTFPIVRVR